MLTTETIKGLFAEFPKDAIHWRAQSVTKDGTKAMALAYIDSRDVMRRLDEVCGAENWQDRYEVHGSKTICYLSVKIGDDWVTKADGAGDTAVEAEKGSISDAFKRAAVKWGIGRYLYDLPAPWVPCESSEWNGKKQWKKWTADPWAFVKEPLKPKADDKPKKASSAEQKRGLADIDNDLLDCETIADVDKLAKTWSAIFKRDEWSRDFIDEAAKKFEPRRQQIRQREADEIADGETGSGIRDATGRELSYAEA